MSVQVRVLFVCMGNICRSPTAEGVFSHLVRARGLHETIEADSAGTGDWHSGEAPDSRAQAMALRHGVDISGQRARVVSARDFTRFHYICAMDRDNLAHLRRKCPKDRQDRLYLFGNFAEEFYGVDVPDPFYGGQAGFAEVFRMVQRASEGLLAAIERDHLAPRKP